MKSRVLYFGEDKEKQTRFEKILEPYEFATCSDAEYVTDLMKVEPPDIIIADADFGGTKKFVKDIKSKFENVYVAALFSDKTDKELSKHSNCILSYNSTDDIILATTDTCLRNKKAQETLYYTNKNLASSLYRLNVLYDTSSKFAGGLDKSKLLDIMIEGMDKALSFSLTCTLSFCNPAEPVLIINSLYELSEEILSALKLRTILNYKMLFDNQKLPYELDEGNLKIIKKVKNPTGRYNFNIFRFDNMFASIGQNEEFYGCIEIFKDTKFSTDDSTCFQTIARQVSIPLKSAALYQEIMETNEKLKKLEKIKSDFISIVSHELRTPLASIKNSVDIVLTGKTGELNPNADKFLKMAHRNILKLSEIINDLLDISKIEAGKMTFNFEKNDINSVIMSAKTSLYAMALEKEIEIITECDKTLPEITADSKRIERVLTNLISNAIKFSDNNKKIKISSQKVNSENINKDNLFKKDLEKLSGDYVLVTVEDEGIGIADKDILRVFDKFSQIENSLMREAGGTGLGLPIAKELIENHHGAIWCESVPNKGSQFKFVLPIE